MGTVATYTYDSSSRLTKVTYPDGSALNFTNDPNSSMILSVTDSQGKLLESHTYNARASRPHLCAGLWRRQRLAQLLDLSDVTLLSPGSSIFRLYFRLVFA